MNEVVVPSKLYRIYWTGRYLERLDSIVRSLLSIISSSEYETWMKNFAANLGVEYRNRKSFLCKILYDENVPSSILHSAKMIRLNLHGTGVERVLREANILVLAAEDRVNCDSLDEVKKHLEDLLFSANRLGKIIEEELVAPPTPPEHVLREQLLHQQQ